MTGPKRVTGRVGPDKNFLLANGKFPDSYFLSEHQISRKFSEGFFLSNKLRTHVPTPYYSDAICEWWRANGTAFPAWALAARIVFAISPNSASCERVFGLLKTLFGEDQMSALADYVHAGSADAELQRAQRGLMRTVGLVRMHTRGKAC